MSIRKRIIQGLGANGFGQGVTILMQLASVPILIQAWGLELYGEWVTLYALPAYLVFSNLGLTATAGNQLAMMADSGDKQSMSEIFQSTWVMVTIVSFSFIAISSALLFTFDLDTLLHMSTTRGVEFNLILVTLFLYIAACMQTGIVQIAFRAMKRYPTAIMGSNVVRLIEWAIATLVAILGGSLLSVAAAFFLSRVFGNAALWIVARRSNGCLRIGISNAKLSHIRVLLKPALATMLFPIGLACSIQGTIILLSAMVGSTSVAIFSIYRTLTRTVIQLTNVLNQAVWPEISYAYGANRFDTVAKIVRKNIGFTSALGASSSLAILIFGEEIIDIWIADKIEHNESLLYTLTAAAFAGVLLLPFWIAQLAINRHVQLAKCFVVVSLLSLFFVYVFVNWLGFTGAGFGILCGEVALLACGLLTFRVSFRENVPSAN